MSKQYQVKIVKPKSRLKEEHDLKTPYKSSKNDSEFYIMELVEKSISKNGLTTFTQLRSYRETVFNQGDKDLLFSNISDTIETGNFTELSSGLLLGASVDGQIMSRKVAPYHILNAKGEIVKTSSGKDSVSETVRFFVPDGEDIEVFAARALNRIPEEAFIKENTSEVNSEENSND